MKIFTAGEMRVLLTVLYQDDDYVAVFKPAGLMVHRNAHDRQGPAALQILRRQFGRKMYPVHRLDRATSGVLVMAFSAEACAALAQMFTQRDIEKTYLTIVRGFAPEQGVINQPIRQRETNVTQDAHTQFQKLAQATWPKPVGRFPEARTSLLAVRPLSGRRHQIRRHLRNLNHPIIGDTRWGDGRHNRYFRTHFESQQLLLMALSLRFSHPLKQRKIHIEAPIDAEFCRLAEIFGWEDAFARIKPWPDSVAEK